jgi:serine/threonine-protein kinase
MLTGRLLFEGLTDYQTLVEHVSKVPVPPSQRSETAIPLELEEIIMACLEKDPDRRPQTARELMATLKAMPLRAAWTPERAEHWWQVHKPTPQSPSEHQLQRLAGEVA